VEEAATRIQAGMRGMLVRSSVTARREQTKDQTGASDVDEDDAGKM